MRSCIHCKVMFDADKICGTLCDTCRNRHRPAQKEEGMITDNELRTAAEVMYRLIFDDESLLP